jgi:hypothetical protein
MAAGFAGVAGKAILDLMSGRKLAVNGDEIFPPPPPSRSIF